MKEASNVSVSANLGVADWLRKAAAGAPGNFAVEKGSFSDNVLWSELA